MLEGRARRQRRTHGLGAEHCKRDPGPAFVVPVAVCERLFRSIVSFKPAALLKIPRAVRILLLKPGSHPFKHLAIEDFHIGIDEEDAVGACALKNPIERRAMWTERRTHEVEAVISLERLKPV